MHCMLCNHEKPTSKFNTHPICTDDGHFKPGRIQICDQCYPNNLDVIIDQVVERIDVDVECDAYVNARRR
jgi:hypothetical protein